VLKPVPVSPIPAEEALPLAERVYRRIRDAIATGALPPRGRLSERELADTLNVSTSPVKAALRRLEAEGMVVTEPRRGTWVAFAPEKLHEMGVIRAALEGVAARLAAERITDAQLAELRGVLEELRRATAAGRTAALAEANDRYHGLILEAADNVFLSNAVRALQGYYRMTRNRMQSVPLEAARAMKEHVAIFEAVRRRNPAGAEAAMRAHIARSVDTLWGMIGAANRKESA